MSISQERLHAWVIRLMHVVRQQTYHILKLKARILQDYRRTTACSTANIRQRVDIVHGMGSVRFLGNDILLTSHATDKALDVGQNTI